MNKILTSHNLGLKRWCSEFDLQVLETYFKYSLHVLFRYKDGKIIIESERIKLTKTSKETFALEIERFKIEDSGSYSVVATNALGSLTENFNLDAITAPHIVKDILSEIFADEGKDLTLDLTVSGTPAPDVKW